jgi:hypothetical protein
MKENLIWVDRIKSKPESAWDKDTMTLKLWDYIRFAWGFKDYRWLIGMSVS